MAMLQSYRANFGFDDDRLGRVVRNQKILLSAVRAKTYLDQNLIRADSAVPVVVEVGGAEWAEVVCIASGPSLTAGDVELVRQWLLAAPGRAVIVTNTTYQLCPWATALYAMDRAWWDVYQDDVKQKFPGKTFTAVRGCYYVQAAGSEHGGNSGIGAIYLAVAKGARRVMLLGYDCKADAGKKHWHADHPKPLKNAGRIKDWPAMFSKAAADLAAVSIVNCSRSTALQCWPVVSLEDGLSCAQ